jgi:AAA15 family ATPase/GTPase
MKPLYSEEAYSQARGKDLLPLICYNCNTKFSKTKSIIKYETKRNRSIKYCSAKCRDSGANKSITCDCGFCGKQCTRKLKEYKGSKSGKIFCSRSCATKYNNTHKILGYRRSKIEIWIEDQLKRLYPDLIILFNDKTIINSELDIYIPSLSLAFELNGIFHYEPIYGQSKLEQIKSNDQNKFFLCQQKQINLCIIDISSMIHFKPLKAQKFLDIICNIINTPSRT